MMMFRMLKSWITPSLTMVSPKTEKKKIVTSCILLVTVSFGGGPNMPTSRKAVSELILEMTSRKK